MGGDTNFDKELIVLDVHKIRFYGDLHHSSGTYEEFVGDDIMEILTSCPFCGNEKLEITNTHTPCYSVECECGVEVCGQGFTPITESFQDYIGAHEEALKDAIERWNHRA